MLSKCMGFDIFIKALLALSVDYKYTGIIFKRNIRLIYISSPDSLICQNH